MRIFKAFMRFARKADISDGVLCEVIEETERGLVAADLGGGVIKQRIARSGQGKSGGFRTLVVFRAGVRAFFVHGFAKNQKDNIGKDELFALKKLASELPPYDDGALAGLVAGGTLPEVCAMSKQHRRGLMASIHETAEGLHAAGAMDKRTLREFDDLCLTPVRPLKPQEIRALRLREGASQAVFARYLNVTTGLVS